MNRKSIMLAVFALALVAVPVSASHLPDTGGNPVNVYSCEQIGSDISIMHTASSTPTTLLSSCRDGGDAHGQLRQYTMSCTTKIQYFVSWKPCGVVEPTYIFNKFGVGFSTSNLFEADYSYLRAGKQYWAKMAGDIPTSWASFNLNANTISGLPVGYTYAFAWTEKSATSGGSAYNSGTLFDENLAKALSKNGIFTPGKNATFVVTDYYRGKMVTALVFARNNDGVSRVANMPVEVDDVIAVHFYVPNKPATTVPVTPTPASSTHLTSLIAVDKGTNYEIAGNQVSYYDSNTFTIGLKHLIPVNVDLLGFTLTPAETKSNLSYAFVWGDRTDDGYNYNSQYVTSLAGKVNFDSSNQINLPINEYYRGKWVLMVGFVRDNDGVSKVPGMPVEVDDVMPLYIYIPAKSSVEPKPEIKPDTVPIVPTPVESTGPACGDIKGGDVTFIVCDEYAVDHYWSGTKIKVVEHDEEMAQVDLVGLNVPEATLGKGETQIFTLVGNPAKYLKVTYLGTGQWGRALIKVQSNTGKKTPNECVNQIGGDGQYIICAGKWLKNVESGIKVQVTSASKTSVFIKATGATKVYFNIKKGAAKSIVQKVKNGVAGSYKYIKVTYKGIQGKKAVVEIEGFEMN